jgi:hypothetical protein
VAQNHDFELALTAAAGEQTNETAEQPVQQTGQQDAQSEPPRPSSPPAHRHRRIEFLYPTRFERVHEPPPVISERLWMADDCKGSAVPLLPRFAAGQMLSSSRG